MHIIFIPYGKRSEVELLLRDMDAQKHKLKMWKGKKVKKIWMQGQVRLLPFGVYEYVCPKEDGDTVMNTLGFKNEHGYKLRVMILGILRKMIKADKIPEYKEDHHYLWIKENVAIIPLGVREDGEYTDGSGEHEGWTHEAI